MDTNQLLHHFGYCSIMTYTSLAAFSAAETTLLLSLGRSFPSLSTIYGFHLTLYLMNISTALLLCSPWYVFSLSSRLQVDYKLLFSFGFISKSLGSSSQIVKARTAFILLKKGPCSQSVMFNRGRIVLFMASPLCTCVPWGVILLVNPKILVEFFSSPLSYVCLCCQCYRFRRSPLESLLGLISSMGWSDVKGIDTYLFFHAFYFCFCDFLFLGYAQQVGHIVSMLYFERSISNLLHVVVVIRYGVGLVLIWCSRLKILVII